MSLGSGTYRFEVVNRVLEILYILHLNGRNVSQTARTVLCITYMLPPGHKMAEHGSLTHKREAKFLFFCLLEQTVWLLHRKHCRL